MMYGNINGYIRYFVLDHWSSKNRCSLIKLTSVDKRKY